MPTTSDDRRREIVALRPRLLEWANALTQDGFEAQALVDDTLTVALSMDHRPPGALTSHAWIHRLLRERFYSVERRRNYQRARGSGVNLELLRQSIAAQVETPHAA